MLRDVIKGNGARDVIDKEVMEVECFHSDTCTSWTSASYYLHF